MPRLSIGINTSWSYLMHTVGDGEYNKKEAKGKKKSAFKSN